MTIRKSFFPFEYVCFLRKLHIKCLVNDHILIPISMFFYYFIYIVPCCCLFYVRSVHWLACFSKNGIIFMMHFRIPQVSYDLKWISFLVIQMNPLRYFPLNNTLKKKLKEKYGDEILFTNHADKSDVLSFQWKANKIINDAWYH